VFGRRANADMVYFHTMKDYRRDQLAPIEAIVDSCTQEQSDEALRLINDDTSDVIEEMVESGITADRILWQQRIVRMHPDMTYDHLDWSEMTVRHDALCGSYRRRYFDLAQRTVQLIDPDVLDLGYLYASQGTKLVNWFYDLVRQMPRHDDETNSEFYRRLNNIMCNVLVDLPNHTIYNNVLGMARHVYSVKRGDSYRDTVLFQKGGPFEQSIFQYYLDALNFYGIGVPNWTVSAVCTSCYQHRVFTDRVAYQRMLWRDGRCDTC
jgi:hypothetical protein